jgi:hypothetical protein
MPTNVVMAMEARTSAVLAFLLIYFSTGGVSNVW